MVIIYSLFTALPAAAKEAKFCPGASGSVESLVSERLASYESEFLQKDRPTFFIGLWVKITPEEKKELSIITRKNDTEMADGLTQMMNTISARLLADRNQLKNWLTENGLQAEVEVLEFPDDGSFLFVKASRKGIEQILCASAIGHLPAYMNNFGI